MNIVIPMAGGGTRFREAGYLKPKPFIDCGGKPMIQRAMDTLDFEAPHTFYVVMMDRQFREFEIRKENVIPVLIKEMTAGAVCTVLKAKEHINNDEPLIIANCDQYIEWDPDKFLRAASACDGALVTFNSTNPHHSYVRIAPEGHIIEVAEKRVISDNANVGVYYFRNGRLFVEMAERMIAKNERTKGEFYIAPVYNELIADGYFIMPYEVDVYKKHHLGTPTELSIFLDKIERGLVC